VPAHPDAEREAAAGEFLRRRDLFRQVHRRCSGTSTIELPSPIRSVQPAIQASMTSGS